MGSGEYLIVAKSPGDFQAATGITTALGPFSGRLSNDGEQIELRDRSDRVMSELDYNDSGEWPVGPDGSGATLAKIDPDADHSKPESWAASDESINSEWVSYSYRGIATADTTPIRRNEFVLGLFGAGEVLLDDSRVVRSPDGAVASLLVNGSFESGQSERRARNPTDVDRHNHSLLRAQSQDEGASRRLLSNPLNSPFFAGTIVKTRLCGS